MSDQLVTILILMALPGVLAWWWLTVHSRSIRTQEVVDQRQAELARQRHDIDAQIALAIERCRLQADLTRAALQLEHAMHHHRAGRARDSHS